MFRMTITTAKNHKSAGQVFSALNNSATKKESKKIECLKTMKGHENTQAQI